MNKKNLLLGSVLIFLIALAYLYQGPYKEWRAAAGKPENFLSDLKTEEINAIDISYIGAETILEKTGDRWKVSGTKDFYVKDDLATLVIDKLTEATRAEVELVSENKDMKNDFQTGENGARVTLRQGTQTLKAFTVGKLGSDFQSTFISEPDSDLTYAIKSNLNTAFIRSDWYDMTIFATEKEKITKIRFQYPTREFTIEKKDGVWTGVLPAVFKVNEEKISKVLDIMTNLSAVKIPDQTFAGTGLEKNSIIVQATGEGFDNTLMVGDKNSEDQYFAKRADSDNIYLITKEQGQELNKRSSDFK